MAYNLKIQGYYFVITDTVSNLECIRRKAKSITFEVEGNTYKFFQDENNAVGSANTYQLGKDVTGFNFTDIIDNRTGLAFPSNSDLTDFLSDVLGEISKSLVLTQSSMPVCVLRSNNDSDTFTRLSPLIIPWNSEKYKDDGFSHDNTIDNTRLIVDGSGTYQIGGRLRIFNTSNQRAQPTIKIFVDGVEQNWSLASGYVRNAGSASDYWTLEFTYEPEKLNANQYIELELSHENQNPNTFISTFIGTESSLWSIKLQVNEYILQ